MAAFPAEAHRAFPVEESALNGIREYRGKRRPDVRAWLFAEDHVAGRTPEPPEIVAAGGCRLNGQLALKVDGVEVYLRPGDWVVFVGDKPAVVLTSAQFDCEYEPAPVLSATDQLQSLRTVLPATDAVRLDEVYRFCLAAGMLETEAYAVAVMALYAEAAGRVVAEGDPDAVAISRRVNALQDLIFRRSMVRRFDEAKRSACAAVPETR